MTVGPRPLYLAPYYYFVGAICVVAVFLAVSMIVLLHRTSQVVHRLTRNIMMLCLLFSMIQQILSIYTYNFSAILRIQNTIWICILVGCCGDTYVNLLIYKMFSSLDERITDRKLLWAKRILFLLYAVLMLPMLVYFVVDKAPYSGPLYLVSNWCGMFMCLVSITFGQIQAFYLSWLIYQKKKTKSDSRVFHQMAVTVVVNFCLAMIDWLALGIQGFQLAKFNTEELYWQGCLCQQAATVLAAIHSIVVVYVFIELKKLTFAGTLQLKEREKASNKSKSKKLTAAGPGRSDPLY
ncbi:hypothetical protein HDV03_003388 [Kappamyces sp. JEL0829]|nr:hypothetical protein HDV03_003388 [Kappamyces sp. JEL0829]